jgi:hypothetical protein
MLPIETSAIECHVKGFPLQYNLPRVQTRPPLPNTMSATLKLKISGAFALLYSNLFTHIAPVQEPLTDQMFSHACADVETFAVPLTMSVP